MGSNKITDDPTTTAAAVSIMGRKRTAPASMTAWSSGIPSRQTQLDEIHQDDRIPHHDARAGDESDHRSRREKRVHQPVRRQDPGQRKRDAAMMISGVRNDWNQPTTRP